MLLALMLAVSPCSRRDLDVSPYLTQKYASCD